MKIDWFKFEEGTCSRDSLIDFVEGAINVNELIYFAPKECKKQIKHVYIWAKGHPQKLGGRSAIEYIQDLAIRSLRRRGHSIHRLPNYVRYEFIG